MASLVSSLSNSFRQVPQAGIPAMLDCILAATASSPSSLFALLLDAFHDLTKDIAKDGKKLDSDQCNHVSSFVCGVCHLLEKSGVNSDAFQSFTWKCFIPLMKIVHACDREMLNQTTESFVDVVIKTNSWGVLEETLVPFLIRSVGLSMGMLQNEESAIYQWTGSSVSQVSIQQRNYSDMIEESMFPLSLPISCHILTSILDAALQSHPEAPTTNLILANECCYAENFAGHLLWDLCNISVQLLSQSWEHRSCTISFLLPLIFKAFVSHKTFEISAHGKTYVLSRTCFLKEIWSCCKALFSLGTLERRDAYTVLSLYLSYFSSTEGCEDVNASDKAKEFDIRAESEFWGEIKRGLVDKEGLVRKQSLHILKTILDVNEGSQCYPGVPEKVSHQKNSSPRGMTKRGRWADKEAKSLGVGKICQSVDLFLTSQQRWLAFILLYEMLEEYGTHLVEAAWNHQITLLLHFSFPNNSVNSLNGEIFQNQMSSLEEIFNWLSILWERGLCHDNPQVRCLIMQSFLGIEWKKHRDFAKSVPESFVFGSFMQALNDPVHHKDFGVKGVYSSRTIDGATRFLQQYTSYLNARGQIAFLSNLASIAKQQSFGRAGLMSLAECIASAANDCQTEWREDAGPNIVQEESASESVSHNDKTVLLDALRFVVECSKQHFNPNYRLRVCERVLEAAASMVCTFNVPLEVLLHFISALPREFTDCGGSLRVKVHQWLLGCGKKHCDADCCSTKMMLLESFYDFPKRFISCHQLVDAFVTYDDEDLDAWGYEAKRWTRVFFLVIKEEQDLVPILKFIQMYGTKIFRAINNVEWVTMKFLIFTLSLVQELQIMQERTADCSVKVRTKSEFGFAESINQLSSSEASIATEKFVNVFVYILEELVTYANLSCSIFWSGVATEDGNLPCSIKGKLGGPSQRRLPLSTSTSVLQAIMSMKTVASISSWCVQLKSDASLNLAFNFLWKSFWKIISCTTCDSEIGAEIHLAAYEALAPVLKAVISVFSPLALDLIGENDKSMLQKAEGKPLLDSLVLTFLQDINSLLGFGALARTRRAILMNWKWHCLESLLSIPYYALKNGVHLEPCATFFSDAAARRIFSDLVESLENAGEGSVLPMLRSVRLALGLFTSGKLGSVVSSCHGVDAQMMWHLVRSSWILHVSCNKRRVAPIAALLSAVLHSSVFNDEGMHVTDNGPGPLKWFVEKILEEGAKSPRTIRLAALHLSGLWLSNPQTIKYYMKELKLLTLYGSVAFDEDFEAELAENHDARNEVSLLAKSPDPELTEIFINTELYARVSVAVLFCKLADLADMVGPINENDDCHAAIESGKLFLLELLDSVVNDTDLSKELYKKYSRIHRHKIRAWQMICVLSRFIHQDIVQRVSCFLHISLYRNNLPSVRQYLETFAIHIYLKFPSLVVDQLVPILQDYDMRPQALSSYVFIAANVILHAPEAVRFRHLDELLPPIIPLLTSHHHSLRGFTQLLVYQIFCKLFPVDSGVSEILSLEKRCFKDLKSYLEKNTDCIRLRKSMAGFLDAFDPNNSVTPSGIFTDRVEELEFECVPTSLMEQVVTFLNDVREDLRCAMAKDMVTIKNERLCVDEDSNCTEISVDTNKEKLLTLMPKDISVDFQKKITLGKHEKQDTSSRSFLDSNETCKPLLEIEKEDQLLDQLLQSRSVAMERIRSSQQHFILVASLIDRIPNLAGLARTCEVFKAAGLAIADTNILHDKQFQLISVTAEKWVPIVEVPVSSVKVFLEKKKQEGFSILGLEQTANSVPLDKYIFPKKIVLVLGREKEGIPVDIIHILDACIEIPQLGVVRSLNVHVSGAIALWEYTRQQRCQ